MGQGGGTSGSPSGSRGETSEGSLLGGRVGYRQLRAGHRTGFEPVLLAAAVAARPGQMVLEAGTGAGAALLCLAARIPGVVGVGVERDAALSALARDNFAANDFKGLVSVRADATSLPFPPDSFHHVLANPPWFDARGTKSPDPLRALAHQAGPGLLSEWVASLTAVLRPRGSVTLILPASGFATASAALGRNCGGITLFPLWPGAGVPAKLVILAARKGVKTADCVRAGLVLHDADGITQAAQEILRDGAACGASPA